MPRERAKKPVSFFFSSADHSAWRSRPVVVPACRAIDCRLAMGVIVLVLGRLGVVRPWSNGGPEPTPSRRPSPRDGARHWKRQSSAACPLRPNRHLRGVIELVEVDLPDGVLHWCRAPVVRRHPVLQPLLEVLEHFFLFNRQALRLHLNLLDPFKSLEKNETFNFFLKNVHPLTRIRIKMNFVCIFILTNLANKKAGK